MFFNKVIVFDSYRQKIFLICSIRTDLLDINYLKGEQTLREMKSLVTAGAFEKRYRSGSRRRLSLCLKSRPTALWWKSQKIHP